MISSGLASAQRRDVTHCQRYLSTLYFLLNLRVRAVDGAARFSAPLRIAWWASYGAPLITVSSDGSARSASPDARYVLILPIVVPFTTIDHWRPAGNAGDFLQSALCLSAGFPVCLVEYMLNIAHSLLHLAFHLLPNAFRLLGFVTGQFSNLLLDFTCNILGSALHLIAIHGMLL
jgi:hypothetical protein